MTVNKSSYLKDMPCSLLTAGSGRPPGCFNRFSALDAKVHVMKSAAFAVTLTRANELT